MRWRKPITHNLSDRITLVICLSITLISAADHRAQSLSFVAPNDSQLDKRIVSQLRGSYSGVLKVHNQELTDAAFASMGREEAGFNMTREEARNLAAVLGCDFYIVVHSRTQRRAGIGKSDYFESYAAFFVVSGRTGRLIKWDLIIESGTDNVDAEQRLTHSMESPKYYDDIKTAWKNEPLEVPKPVMEQIPDPDSAAAKSFRPPVPYLRLKPEYTRLAYLYDITATVEAMVDLDEKGQITRVDIERWAGYGLDESVISAIKAMNWRPAERGGKALPIRFLLRYNFKKLDKAQPNDE